MTIIVNDEDTWASLKSFFDIEFSADNLKGKYTRTIGITGGPLEVDGIRYKDKMDRTLEQDEANYERENFLL